MKHSHLNVLYLLAIFAALTLVSFGPFHFFLPKVEQVGFNMLPPNGECPPYAQEELHDLNDISVFPDGDSLNTRMVVRMRDRCVPVWGGLNSEPPRTEWVMEKIRLQTYGFPKSPNTPIQPNNPNDPNTVWSSPGPLFHLKKASSPSARDGSRFRMTLYNRLPLNQEGPGECAFYENPDLTYPNCFHGDQTTNFHFHGFHVSPQPHQDFVGVRIYPKGTPSSGDPNQAIGQYRYNLDPLPWTQAEGTHWYHAHKHGSTSLQVLNGLVGVFLIEGPFDKWLRDFYRSHTLREKPIVIQQIRQFLWVGQPTEPRVRYTLVNGQANPIIKMNPGEIQRWRFISGTMQASAQVRLTFEGLEAKQIAMDGVPFAPENYHRQPLLNNGAFEIDPGNRADFLVQAPFKGGRYYVTVEVIGAVQSGRRTEIDTRDQEIIDSIPNYPYEHPPLVSIDVGGYAKRMRFPDFLPPLPEYLEDIPSPPKERHVLYSMGGAQPPTVEFTIDGVKFDPSCANQTVLINSTEQWRLENDSTVLHPFHIHVNPFQVVENEGIRYSPPYVWQDTIAIPAGTPQDKGVAVIYQRFLDFTGGHVQHCHILGHEDRGMMLGVQTVCPNGQYGKPTSREGPECRPGRYIPALPQCGNS